MRKSLVIMGMLAALSLPTVCWADEENAEDFMNLHQIEIAFHEAGSTRNLELMLSLFSDDAVLTARSKTPTGEEQVKTYTVKSRLSNTGRNIRLSSRKTNG